MAPQVPVVECNNGTKIPIIGLGTWQSKPGEVREAVKAAIECGYRHLDGAFLYHNEEEVGAGIKSKIQDGTVKREDLYITSKLWDTFHRRDLVVPMLKQQLATLGLDYLDLYLIHWPMALKEGDELIPFDKDGMMVASSVGILETWSAMEECVRLGLTKSIGLSNFNSEQISRILDNCTIKPVTNQVECHPYLNQKKLRDFCHSKGITITAYSPLGSPARPGAKPGDIVLLEDPKIAILAKKYNKTPAQILIRYQIDQGIIVIPKSVSKARIESNFQVFDFSLTKEDILTIDSLDCNGRINPELPAINHREYPFHIEF